jgi:hypothetical protein
MKGGKLLREISSKVAGHIGFPLPSKSLKCVDLASPVGTASPAPPPPKPDFANTSDDQPRGYKRKLGFESRA